MSPRLTTLLDSLARLFAALGLLALEAEDSAFRWDHPEAASKLRD